MKQNQNNANRTLHLPPFIQQDVPLGDKNWFGTGGNAQYFATPKNNDEFSQALNIAHKHTLPITLIGQGANMLISDDGIEGLVIQSNLNSMTIVNDQFVFAGAGTTMHDLINFCLDHNLIGLEEFSGIPGTIGGSVFINLHYFQFLLSHFLVSAHVIHQHTGEIINVDNAWFNFGYNDSTLHHEPYYVLDATFKLAKVSDAECAYARGRSAEIIRHRTARYPSKNTCGSFFRNFHEHEVTLESNGKKMIHVAYYLDKIGVKGALKVGDAVVSWQHANMIVNSGNATTQDIVDVARHMQKLVQDKFGIMPQPECRLVGFQNNPFEYFI